MIKLPTLKLIMMVNCLLLLLVAFVIFFNQNPPTLDANPISTASSTENPAITAAIMSTTNPDLANLPYVSADGLKQQAQAVMYSTASQPRIQARSSR